MSPGRRVLLLFPTIHHVLAAERALKVGGVVPDLVPVPREISSDCGMAITIAAADRPRALELLADPRPSGIVDDWE